MPLQSRWPLFDASESTWCPSAIEREREVPSVRDPEVAVEAALEFGRFLLEAVGERRVVPDQSREAGASDLRVVGVALELARGPGEPGQPPVPVGDRIPRVLPALVLEPRLLVAAPIPDVAIAEEVGVVVDPGEGGPRLVLALSDQRAVAGPPLVLVQQDHVQGGGVRAAVVRGVQVAPRTPSSRRTASRGGCGPGPRRGSRRPAALPVPECLQGRRRQLGREGQRLQAGEDAVAAEHGHEPGEPGRGKAPPTGDQRREAERGQVDQAAAVGRPSAGRRRIPGEAPPRASSRGSGPCSAGPGVPRAGTWGERSVRRHRRRSRRPGRSSTSREVRW